MSSAMKAHLNRELMHESWKVLLSDSVVKAWEDGLVATCSDGIERRFYLRIATYSADYPEK